MGKHEKKPGRHAKPATCGHIWTSRSDPKLDLRRHVCGLVSGHRGGHVCRDWDCSETA